RADGLDPLPLERDRGRGGPDLLPATGAGRGSAHRNLKRVLSALATRVLRCASGVPPGGGGTDGRGGEWLGTARSVHRRTPAGGRGGGGRPGGVRPAAHPHLETAVDRPVPVARRDEGLADRRGPRPGPCPTGERVVDLRSPRRAAAGMGRRVSPRGWGPRRAD